MSRVPFAVLALAGFAALPVRPARAQRPDTTAAVPDSVTVERVLAGSDLFNGGTCTFCHAVAGRGTGRRAPDLSDAEWLHSTGDFDGIQHTIFWGVEKDEMKALEPRPFAMNPKGGMMIDNEATKALAAYVWTLSHPGTNEFVAEQARFLTLARDGREDDAVAAFHQAGERWEGHPLLAERGLNALGYEIMAARGAAAALPLFALNAELHPDSWNVWDSLGEARAGAGDTAGAIRDYQKSIELNPDNENGKKALEKLRGGA